MFLRDPSFNWGDGDPTTATPGQPGYDLFVDDEAYAADPLDASLKAYGFGGYRNWADNYVPNMKNNSSNLRDAIQGAIFVAAAATGGAALTGAAETGTALTAAGAGTGSGTAAAYMAETGLTAEQLAAAQASYLAEGGSMAALTAGSATAGAGSAVPGAVPGTVSAYLAETGLPASQIAASQAAYAAEGGSMAALTGGTALTTQAAKTAAGGITGKDVIDGLKVAGTLGTLATLSQVSKAVKAAGGGGAPTAQLPPGPPVAESPTAGTLSPDDDALRKKAKQLFGTGGAFAGNGSTFLTGPGGVKTSDLNLGKATLLGS